MTPKEKAEELIQKFLPHAKLTTEIGEHPIGREKHAIECAILYIRLQRDELDRFYWETNKTRRSSEIATKYHETNDFWNKVLESLNEDPLEQFKLLAI